MCHKKIMFIISYRYNLCDLLIIQVMLTSGLWLKQGLKCRMKVVFGHKLFVTSFNGWRDCSRGSGIMGVRGSFGAQNMWDLQTLQCDGPPQQSAFSVTQTMVGLFNHRRTSVPAICLHTPTVQTLCDTHTHTQTLLPPPKTHSHPTVIHVLTDTVQKCPSYWVMLILKTLLELFTFTHVQSVY